MTPYIEAVIFWCVVVMSVVAVCLDVFYWRVV